MTSVLPGMAVPIYFPNGHSLTVAEHTMLADAKVLRFDELDDLAREYRDDELVKRGNVQALGPRPHPLAYVVGAGIVAIAPGLRDATYGGWVRPGGESVSRVTGYDREADRRAQLETNQRARAADAALAWDERLLRGAR